LTKFRALLHDDEEVKLERGNTQLENITQVTLNITDLLALILKNKDIIESVEYEYNPMLKCAYKSNSEDFEKIITEWSKDSKVPATRLILS
jgi:hypothetical protein